MADDTNRVERPRVEPEIIPPDRGRGTEHPAPWQNSSFAWTRGTQRLYVARLGPFGIALLVLALAAIAAIVTIALLGAVLIWIPVVAVLVVIAAIFRLLRG